MVYEKSAETELERIVHEMAQSGKGRELLEVIQKALIQADSGELEIAAKYTRRVFHSPRKTRRKSSNVAFGGLLGGPLTAQQSELITLWDQLTVDQQQSVLGLARLLVSKKHECD